MKKLLYFACASAFFVACSSDDDNTNHDTDSANVYMPLESGNYWTYDVTGTGISARDSLYVASDTIVEGQQYSKMKTLLPIATGFFTQSLRNNALRKVGSSIQLHGNAGFNLGGAIPVEIHLDDFVLFRENATDGEALSVVDGTIEQEFDDYPLSLDYSISSTAGASLVNYTVPGGQTFSDVKSVRVIWNLGLSTTVTFGGFEINVPVMAPQDVLVSTYYFAKDVGMVYGTTTLSYDLEDFSQAGVDLPIPATANETQHERLDEWQVAD